jgi:hypothetical protein
MNNVHRNLALAAIAASAIALSVSTSEANVALYPWIAPPAASHSTVMQRATTAHDIRVRSTAWSPQECVPGGYWYMYRSGQASVPIACEGTRAYHIL